MMEAHVEELLRAGLSPEQIAGYIERTGNLRKVCHKTIYSWVHRKWQSRKAFLRFKGKPRVPYGDKKRVWQPHKRHISERPLIVEKRRRVGDWEADLVHGTQDDSRHCLLTLNDRASGFCIIWKIQTLYPLAVAHIMAIALRGLPVKTITCDNVLSWEARVDFGQAGLVAPCHAGRRGNCDPSGLHRRRDRSPP
jgi:transposase, IS30 family